MSEYRSTIAYGVRRGWISFPPDNAPELDYNTRLKLGKIPRFGDEVQGELGSSEPYKLAPLGSNPGPATIPPQVLNSTL